VRLPLPHRVLLVTGLKREARILGGDGAQVIVGGGCSTRLAQDLEQAAAKGVAAFLSMGIAGGLLPGLSPGAIIIASAVVASKARIRTATTWSENLRRAIPESIMGDIAGVDRITAEISDKAALHQVSGATAVDMESHVVAQVADRYGIPFAAIRIISDPAEQALPRAAQVGLAPNGGVNLTAVIGALMAAPGQIPALVQTALDAQKAFRTLSRCRRLIGSGFCLPDFAKLPLDVP
jgi:hopanoid-associated phosphorylase